MSAVHCSSSRRAQAKHCAKLSADNAIASLKSDLNETRAKLVDITSTLTFLATDEELVKRILAVVPALRSLLQGRQPAVADRLRRNVALHSWRADNVLHASVPALRQAQRGPRLQPDAAVAAPGKPRPQATLPGVC